jgi:epsilon-lactone hydrolase
MPALTHSSFLSLVATAMLVWPALAQTAAIRTDVEADFATVESAQNAANPQAGPRAVPGRSIPVSDTVSPQLQSAIAAPYRCRPGTRTRRAPRSGKSSLPSSRTPGRPPGPRFAKSSAKTMQPAVVGGVKAFILQPKEIPAENRNRLLVHVHGGGYVYNPGEAGTQEGTLMAA